MRCYFRAEVEGISERHNVCASSRSQQGKHLFTSAAWRPTWPSGCQGGRQSVFGGQGSVVRGRWQLVRETHRRVLPCIAHFLAKAQRRREAAFHVVRFTHPTEIHSLGARGDNCIRGTFPRRTEGTRSNSPARKAATVKLPSRFWAVSGLRLVPMTPRKGACAGVGERSGMDGLSEVAGRVCRDINVESPLTPDWSIAHCPSRPLVWRQYFGTLNCVMAKQELNDLYCRRSVGCN
jgi:hypothetical protein